MSDNGNQAGSQAAVVQLDYASPSARAKASTAGTILGTICVLSATTTFILLIGLAPHLEEPGWELLGLPVAFVTGVASFLVAHRSRFHERAEGRRFWRLGTGRPLAALGLLFASLIFLLLINQPSLSRSREAAVRIRCGQNLRQIGVAMREYHAAHGVLPSDLSMLGVPEHELLCPNAEGEPAKPGGALVYGLTLSYVVLNDAAAASGDPKIVAAIEAPALHRGEGASVLYADGSVRWLVSDDIALIVQELQRDGRWPFQVDPRPFLQARRARTGPATRGR